MYLSINLLGLIKTYRAVKSTDINWLFKLSQKLQRNNLIPFLALEILIISVIYGRKIWELEIFLKLPQNKKGWKNLQQHRCLNTFSQLPAVKKYSKNGAAGKLFGPSCFDPAFLFTFFNTNNFWKMLGDAGRFFNRNSDRNS